MLLDLPFNRHHRNSRAHAKRRPVDEGEKFLAVNPAPQKSRAFSPGKTAKELRGWFMPLWSLGWEGTPPLVRKFPASISRERESASLGAARDARRGGRRIRSYVTIGILSALLFFSPISAVFGQGIYKIDPRRSQIKGVVKYSVIGKYVAWFRDFNGTFVFYPQEPQKSSVTLSIAAASLHSKHPRLDRLAKSKRLLYTQKYPDLVFVGQSIHRLPGGDGHSYQVTGALTMHGVTKEMSFPFKVFGPEQDKNGSRIKASGTWVVDRKDFGIFWHAVLDRGGIVVGDHLTVDWQIVGLQQDTAAPDGAQTAPLKGPPPR